MGLIEDDEIIFEDDEIKAFNEKYKELADFCAEYGMELIDLSRITIPKDVIDFATPDIIARYRFIPISFEKDVLTVAIADPKDIETLDSLRYILKTDIEGTISPEEQLNEAIEKYYGEAIRIMRASFDDDYNAIEEFKKDLEERGLTDLASIVVGDKKSIEAIRDYDLDDIIFKHRNSISCKDKDCVHNHDFGSKCKLGYEIEIDYKGRCTKFKQKPGTDCSE